MKARTLQNTLAAAVAAVSLTLAFTAHAADSKPAAEAPAPAEKAAKPKAKTYEGTLEKYDTKARTLTVKKIMVSKDFQLTSDAKFIALDRKEVTAGDFKVGDEVRVGYREEGGKPMAYRLTHIEKKATAAKTPSEPTPAPKKTK